jgi:hypothetical protein
MPRHSCCVILIVALAILVGGSLGTSNGKVLCIDADGHLALEVPHLRHGHSHAPGADNESHDRDRNAEPGDLHDSLATCSDSFLTVLKLERPSSTDAAAQHQLAAPCLCVPACLTMGAPPFPFIDGLGVSAFGGGTARADLSSLRCIVLLV